MTIYLPPVLFVALAAYFVLGIILYVPLVYWSNRFISPKGSPWRGASIGRVAVRIFISGVFWPVDIYTSIRYEIKYGVFK